VGGKDVRTLMWLDMVEAALGIERIVTVNPPTSTPLRRRCSPIMCSKHSSEQFCNLPSVQTTYDSNAACQDVCNRVG